MDLREQTFSAPESRSSLNPDAVYSPRQLARVLGDGRGTMPIYRAIRAGALRAAPLNERGDLAIRGIWAINWLEQLAAGPRPRDSRTTEAR